MLLIILVDVKSIVELQIIWHQSYFSRIQNTKQLKLMYGH
jgi:hypothetical protein